MFSPPHLPLPFSSGPWPGGGVDLLVTCAGCAWVEKFVFWKAQYAGILAERKLCYVLKAPSFALCESLWLEWLEGLIFCLQNVIYNHMHTQAPRHIHLSMLPHNKCGKKKQRKIQGICALCSREQGMPMCQSFSQEGLLLPVFKTKRK